MERGQLDNQTEGQMTIYDLLDDGKPNKLFAISRVFARALKEMNLAERKAFTFVLSNIKFKEKATSNIISVNKKELSKVVGINSDADHRSRNLYRAIENLPGHSQIKVSKEDREKYKYKSGIVVNEVTVDETNEVKVEIREKYMTLFTDLMRTDSNNPGFLIMWADDIFQMKSDRSITFYEKLREETDTRIEINSYAFGVKTLKELFNIPKTGKGSYMRGKDGFDRSNFEKRVIEPLCEDMKNCKMLTLLMQPDGKYYEKVKSGNRVDGYRFHWVYTSHPAVATATEVKEIQERVDKNPEVLKVTKDILAGKKKKKENGFKNFQQREISDEMIRQLEQADMREP